VARIAVEDLKKAGANVNGDGGSGEEKEEEQPKLI
jgi:hypothetical protein